MGTVAKCERARRPAQLVAGDSFIGFVDELDLGGYRLPEIKQGLLTLLECCARSIMTAPGGRETLLRLIAQVTTDREPPAPSANGTRTLAAGWASPIPVMVLPKC
jgi:hypothetical protein